ncbi:MAG: adenosylmethionine decarboxylase [Bacteroidota bacterium]
MFKPLGKHIILELYDCPETLLDNTEALRQIFCAAAEEMGATLVTNEFHHFSPIGVSGVVIIQESHLTVHTWPEYGYAAVDVFTCGQIDLEKGIAFLTKELQAQESAWEMLERGIKNFEKVRQASR